MALSTTIKSIQDIMRKDVGVDGDAQRIGQLVWLLFLKIWNDREQELELLEDDFASPLVDVTWVEEGETRTAEDLCWSAWAADREGATAQRGICAVHWHQDQCAVFREGEVHHRGLVLRTSLPGRLQVLLQDQADAD